MGKTITMQKNLEAAQMATYRLLKPERISLTSERATDDLSVMSDHPPKTKRAANPEGRVPR